MTTNGHRPCPHRHRPKVALGKCQVCWGRWRARHSEADVRAALRRECKRCRRVFEPYDPRREYCCRGCTELDRYVSPLEHLYVVWTEYEARRIAGTYQEHGFVRVPRLTSAGRPAEPYFAAWHRDPPGCYVIRAAKLPEELSPIFGGRLDGAPQKGLS